MQTSILERIRVLEADLERSFEAAVQQRAVHITNDRHVLLRDRFVREERHRMRDLADRLLDLYLDGDDIVAAQNEEWELPAALKVFNARVADMREYYRTHPQAGDAAAEEEALAMPDPNTLLEGGIFTADERCGTRLRYREHYERYTYFLQQCAIQHKGVVDSVVKIDMDRFMFHLVQPAQETPQSLKVAFPTEYLSFIGQLRDYLVSFHERARPTEDAKREQQLATAARYVDEYWTSLEAAAEKASTSRFATAAPVSRKHRCLIVDWDLRPLSGEQRAQAKAAALAESQVAMLVQTGGAMNDLAGRSAKDTQADATKLPSEVQREEDGAEEAFLLSVEDAERRLTVATAKDTLKASDGLDPNLLSLQQGGSSDQQLTSQFLAGETADVAMGAVVMQRGGEYFDEDGNAIPLWKIKMQGLRKKFMCEICGGTIYSGPKVFEEHFNDERHGEGLQRLGLRNCAALYGVSTIQGALRLSEHLRSRSVAKRLRDDWDEQELEDAAGTVMPTRVWRKHQSA